MEKGQKTQFKDWGGSEVSFNRNQNKILARVTKNLSRQKIDVLAAELETQIEIFNCQSISVLLEAPSFSSSLKIAKILFLSARLRKFQLHVKLYFSDIYHPWAMATAPGIEFLFNLCVKHRVIFMPYLAESSQVEIPAS